MVYCHAVATSPAYRSRAGSSGSLQAGSRLVAYFVRRPLIAFWSTSCDRRSSRAPLRDFRWARDPSRHRSSDPTGRASESEGYVRAGVYRCSSPENLVSSSPAISKRLKTFGFAPTRPESRGGRLSRRCFLAWCTQFQITHVFLEAVLLLRPSDFLKTCESLFTSRHGPEAFTKTHRHRADIRDMTNLERRLIDDDDGATPASHYSTIASHRDLRRCHDGGTARPRSPRARPTSSLRERPGRVRSCSSSPARPHVGRAGPWAPRPSGSERSSSGPSCSPCTVTPTSSSYLPRVSFPSLPQRS